VSWTWCFPVTNLMAKHLIMNNSVNDRVWISLGGQGPVLYRWRSVFSLRPILGIYQDFFDTVVAVSLVFPKTVYTDF